VLRGVCSNAGVRCPPPQLAAKLDEAAARDQAQREEAQELQRALHEAHQHAAALERQLAQASDA
jgi:hypothetical protein